MSLVALLGTVTPSAPQSTAQPSLQALQAELPTGILPTVPEPELSSEQLSYTHRKVPVLQILFQICLQKRERGKKGGYY